MVTKESVSAKVLWVANILEQNPLGLYISLFCTLDEDVNHVVHSAKGPLWIEILDSRHLGAYFIKCLKRFLEILENFLLSNPFWLILGFFEQVGVF